MKLCTAVQEGCGYKDTLGTHRYYVPLAKYFTVCINYQPTLVKLSKVFLENNIYLLFVFSNHITVSSLQLLNVAMERQHWATLAV